MDKSEIVIAFSGMPVGPTTLQVKSLGGSETAAISLAKELKVLGHIVTVFCNLPAEGLPDYFESGRIADDGVRYISLEAYQNFITTTNVDLLIAQRTPELLALPHQASKAVLWVHDLATYTGPVEKLPGIAHNFDEIWCVSEWHRQQYHTVSGYPLESIKVLRNCITKWPLMNLGEPDKFGLVYAARPERGLEALVRPGGIMSKLPEYVLHVAMYDNFPEHMQAYYKQLIDWGRELGNIKFHGSLTQFQLRQLIACSAAYVYPTEFEETSCILAQEVMEQGRVFVTCKSGALPETLGDYATFYDYKSSWNSDEFCTLFANLIQKAAEEPDFDMLKDMSKHRYWNEAAKEVSEMIKPRELSKFSQFWSLIEDSDVIPAKALFEEFRKNSLDKIFDSTVVDYANRMMKLYPYLYGLETFESYYERYFKREDSKGAREHRSSKGSARFEKIAEQIAALPDGSHILDYGCAEGVIILDLAEMFPNKQFTGVDFAATNVALCEKYATDLNLNNVKFKKGNSENIDSVSEPRIFDAIICSEVLEHVLEPWVVISSLETRAKLGGRIILTVPSGPWEAIGLYDKDQYPWRAHIWHINKWMLRTMFADKQNAQMSYLFNGHNDSGVSLGHTVFCYDSDDVKAHPIYPLEKAYRARKYETATACIITHSSETLGKTLRTIATEVQVVHISISTDDPREMENIYALARQYRLNHPWLVVSVNKIPSIKPREFGFDDARNKSVEAVGTDWVLWIDSDEYLAGNIRKYLRNNAYDAYAINQHHFTVDPRGAPAQIDKPARLYRYDRGLQFYGKIHEHAEKGFNGGPGFCTILPDVDIGHHGYVNEQVRRNRFQRNWPFMLWDHEVNADRKIGKFLWLRDIVHRMRYMADSKNINQARLLAREAIDYYNQNWEKWDAAGQGGDSALSYYSEAKSLIGEGYDVDFAANFEGYQAQVKGRFDSEEQLGEFVKNLFKDHYARRSSKYWR